MDTGKNSSSIFGSPAEYKMLVLKISEYPINKELLRRYMQDIAPSGCFVRESSAKGYGARPTEEKALRIADLKRRISEVDRALQKVPQEYRSGVLYHTVHHGCKGIQGGKGCSCAVGYSIINRTSKVDVGSLMLKYGGGGHKAVGTCQLSDDEMDAKIPEIIDAIINYQE